jgi:CopG family transcriptional regulator/antitoxin EndoAI
MAKRMNVILQDATVQVIRRAAKAGERSRYIDRAIQHYAATRSPEALREQLKLAALRDSDLVEDIARDWSAVDAEAWHTIPRGEARGQRPARGAAKSTS